MADNFTYHEEYRDPTTKRIRKHVYLMGDKYMSGVTTILGTIAKPALIQWASDMAVGWIKENCNAEPIMANPTAGFVYEVTTEQLEEARKAHTKKKEDAGQKGTDLHADVEHYIKECIERADGKPLILRPHLEAKGGFAVGVYSGKIDLPPTGLVAFVNWANENNIRFLASEKKVYHSDPSMWYAGTFDFSFEKNGKRYIGDLKTMKKMWDRVPFFQTAAYMLAAEHMGEEKYDGSCIVNISKETNELTDHWTYDHEKDKEAFLAALTLYRQLSNF